MGPGQLGRHRHGLEDLITVHGQGLQPGDDTVLDVAGHALEVHGDPVGLKLSDGKIYQILNKLSEGWGFLVFCVGWCCLAIFGNDFLAIQSVPFYHLYPFILCIAIQKELIPEKKNLNKEY